ncbi:hypothetical protein HanPSC8_Chr02g0046431 [Helianthus annuus]|nr:hypothetical protein HanPSC8_Chr02g0046431 [Helianthus annuus]
MLMMMSEVVAEWRWSRGDGGVEAGAAEVVMMMMMAEQWWCGGGGGAGAEHGWRWRWCQEEVKLFLEKLWFYHFLMKRLGRDRKHFSKKKNKHSFEAKHLPASARCRQKRQEALFVKKTNTTLMSVFPLFLGYTHIYMSPPSFLQLHNIKI